MACLLLLTALAWSQQGAVASGDVTVVVRDPGLPYSLAEYRDALQRWIQHYERTADLDCCTAPDEGMPRFITVRDGEREFQVPLPDLKYHEPEPEGMSAEEAGKDNREHVLSALRQLQSSLGDYDKQPSVSAEAAQAAATQILSAHEYRQVRLPGKRESWRDAIVAWLRDRLSGLFASTPDVRFIARLIVWTIVLITVLAAGIFLWRLMQRDDADPRWHLGAAPLTVSAKPWTQWLTESRAAAAAGDWRQAVRLGYWAGISALESRGAWKPDLARTPREYLKLISPQEPSARTLGALTRDFERVWYAQSDAREEDLQRVLQHLGELGCR